MILLILGLFVVSCHGYTPFRLTDCKNSTRRVVTLDGAPQEYPITFPGHVSVPATVTVHRPVEGPYTLDVTVEKFFFFDYFALPCFSNVGSCTYDPCALLNWFRNACPWQLRESDFPCTCQTVTQNTTYRLQPHPFYIPGLNSAWQWIAYGDFRVTGRLIEDATGEEVNCYSLEFTVQAALPELSWDIWDW
ncbi:ganglioside GM2 activator-like [Mya arenaria]|uniref:ganglioside GM2 activator-like n=1 Tax=Mya arenaria TaxID=6604 RepID=UPI0022E7B407|nr:ganglioside GM2 activator-like [Mya arenaria]